MYMCVYLVPDLRITRTLPVVHYPNIAVKEKHKMHEKVQPNMDVLSSSSDTSYPEREDPLHTTAGRGRVRPRLPGTV